MSGETILSGQVAWVTGAGSGIGEAAARALAADGAHVVLTGRGAAALERVAAGIAEAGGLVSVHPADMTDRAAVETAAGAILARHDRIDLLVNNAGSNIADRSWAALTAEGVDSLLAPNLSAPFYAAIAVLPAMRAQKNGLLIHTASWAGRHPSPVSGAAYSAAKQAVIAMSHLLNAEECVNGIRSTVLCPAEVATPILDRRPVPTPAEARARMLQPEDLGALIRWIAALPPHVCINEVVLSPTWNRMFDAVARREAASSAS